MKVLSPWCLVLQEPGLLNSEGSLTLQGMMSSLHKLRYGLVISWVLFSPCLSSLFFYSPFLLRVIVGYILSEVIFNTLCFSGCVFDLGRQRESPCERPGLWSPGGGVSPWSRAINRHVREQPWEQRGCRVLWPRHAEDGDSVLHTASCLAGQLQGEAGRISATAKLRLLVDDILKLVTWMAGMKVP